MMFNTTSAGETLPPCHNNSFRQQRSRVSTLRAPRVVLFFVFFLSFNCSVWGPYSDHYVPHYAVHIAHVRLAFSSHTLGASISMRNLFHRVCIGEAKPKKKYGGATTEKANHSLPKNYYQYCHSFAPQMSENESIRRKIDAKPEN